MPNGLTVRLPFFILELKHIAGGVTSSEAILPFPLHEAEVNVVRQSIYKFIHVILCVGGEAQRFHGVRQHLACDKLCGRHGAQANLQPLTYTVQSTVAVLALKQAFRLVRHLRRRLWIDHALITRSGSRDLLLVRLYSVHIVQGLHVRSRHPRRLWRHVASVCEGTRAEELHRTALFRHEERRLMSLGCGWRVAQQLCPGEIAGV
mmetsp:Transcript_72922/g.170838  ORF Transcript_72922/g.170838 Transcript_72922/m.170838 type:complete len:205 (-) Transcript_72922:209-823(-)